MIVTPDSNEMKIISTTPDTISEYGFCGYKDVSKHKEMVRKIDWFREYYPRGLRIKTLVSPEKGSQGMIEYIPGEYAHRPVSAADYLFIHCLFVGYRREFKGQGYGSRLIEECIEDARRQGKDGVAVVTRKGSFMANRDVFLKNGFTVIDKRKPDFELLAFRFEGASAPPAFLDVPADKYGDGLYILRSPQCPYTEKNVMAMMETAREMGLEPKLVELEDHEAAQVNPSPFGSFALICNGELLSPHPVSNTRFRNIMGKLDRA